MSRHTATADRAAQTVPYGLDMDEVAAELYAALQHIESLNPGAADYFTDITQRDSAIGNANTNPNTNFAPHTPIPCPNPA